MPVDTKTCVTCGEPFDWQASWGDTASCPHCGQKYDVESELIDTEEESWVFWLSPVKDEPDAD